MNLIDLVLLNNRLSGMTMQDLQQESQHRFELIAGQANVPDAGIDLRFQQRLTEKSQLLQGLFGDFEQELSALKDEVDRLIQSTGQEWLHRNYTEYENYLQSKHAQTPEYLGLHRNKVTQISPEKNELLKNRIGVYCNWHNPVMVIHPFQEPFIHEMTGGDPLYIVDESHYLLEPTMAQFVQGYQNRLRPYVIEESFDYPILGQLPDQQIAFCLVYNYLDYRPFELVKIYLQEIYEKLLPGGVVGMTFNDCDRWQAMQGVEQGITGYTPGSLVRAWAKYVGFEELYSYYDDQPSVWIEFKKPGELTSLRGGQCLAKILPKPVAKSK